MKLLLPGIFCFLISCNLFAQNPGTVSTESELEALLNVGTLPQYPSGSVFQFSSYDTTGYNDDGFSGKYSFIRKNPDQSLVIFEAKGNGVINRIWTPTPTDDTLDFYFGGNSKPDYSIRFSDLFSGKVAPFLAPLTGNQIGGYFSYVPIPFRNGCKVVFRGKNLMFYQIQYRSYPASAKVSNFSGKADKKTIDLITKMAGIWEKQSKQLADFAGQHSSKISVDSVIKPGQTITLANLNRPGRITGIELMDAHLFEGLHKQVDIRVSWDNDSKPAIYAPVADFFGYAFGKVSTQSLLIGTAENMNYSYFPMPFDQSARVELIYRSLPQNKNQEPIRIRANVYHTAQKRDKKTEGRFYAFWNKNINPPAGQPHLFLEGSGKGHYVGTILQSQGLKPGMTLFFEGDDSTVVDGKLTMHGTGSEDYFNGGWYALLDRWDQKMSLPLHGSLDYSLPMARTGGYRLFISDKFPFSKTLHHSMEHGPEGNNFPVDYTSLAFYYAENPLQTNPAPTNELSVVFEPDTLIVFPQLMKFSFTGEITVNGNNISAKNGGQVRIDLAEIPHGRYKLYADADTDPDGATIELWQRQTKMRDGISFNSASKKRVSRLEMGEIILNEFRSTITLEFKRDDPKNRIHIHNLILIREK